jgi:hypothetical protein
MSSATTAPLGGTTGFAFVIGANTWAGDTITAHDRAPDGGSWVRAG